MLPGKAWWIKNKGNTSRHASLASNLHDFRVGDTITIEVDLEAQTCTFSKNGAELDNGLADQTVVGPVSLWINLDYDEQISIVEFEHVVPDALATAVANNDKAMATALLKMGASPLASPLVQLDVPEGVQYGLPASFLDGWTEHYNEPYSHKTTEACECCGVWGRRGRHGCKRPWC